MQALDELSNQHTQSYTHHTLSLQTQLTKSPFSFSLSLQRPKRVIDFTYFPTMDPNPTQRKKHPKKRKKGRPTLHFYNVNDPKKDLIKFHNLFWLLGGQSMSGRGRVSRKDLNSTSDLFGCEKGASCDAPLTVANDNMFPYASVHPPTCKPKAQ